MRLGPTPALLAERFGVEAVVKLGARGAVGLARRARWQRTPASTWRPSTSSAPAMRSRPATSTRCSTAPSLADALRRANACGAVAVAAVGDATGLPTRSELERVLAGGGDVVR